MTEKPAPGDEEACAWATSSRPWGTLCSSQRARGKARPPQPESCPGQCYPCWNCGQWSVASHKLVPGKADSGDIQGSVEEGVCPARRSESTGSERPTSGLAPCRPEPHIPRVAVWSQHLRVWPAVLSAAGAAGRSRGSGRALLRTGEEGSDRGAGWEASPGKCARLAHSSPTSASALRGGVLCPRPQEARVLAGSVFPVRGKVATFADACSLRAALPPGWCLLERGSWWWRRAWSRPGSHPGRVLAPARPRTGSRCPHM